MSPRLSLNAVTSCRSVGCVVIELLEGKPPYYSLEPMQALFRIVQDDMPPIPDGASAVSIGCTEERNKLMFAVKGCERLLISVLPERPESTYIGKEAGKTSMDGCCTASGRRHHGRCQTWQFKYLSETEQPDLCESVQAEDIDSKEKASE